MLLPIKNTTGNDNVEVCICYNVEPFLSLWKVEMITHFGFLVVFWEELVFFFLGFRGWVFSLPHFGDFLLSSSVWIFGALGMRVDSEPFLYLWIILSDIFLLERGVEETKKGGTWRGLGRRRGRGNTKPWWQNARRPSSVSSSCRNSRTFLLFLFPFLL